MATILDQETDARFWAQTGFKPGQKLDPSDPNDAKMVPVWKDIYAKVKRESDAGKLVTTFDHPAVAQNLADAHAADQTASAHLDAAKTAPDAATGQQHVEAAASAADVSAQKTSAAASVQPPTASPPLTQAASQAAKQDQPPAHAHGKHHLANAQAQAAGTRMQSPRSLIDRETDARFWAQTHFKPGQKLDPNDPTDAKMVPVWLDIYQKVRAEDAAGKLVLTYNHPVVAQNLADAQVADQVAAAHIDAAAAAPDATTAHQNVTAASTAAQVSSQKTRDAARHQPPTVSPPIAQEASRRARGDQDLNKETYARFWATTHYKPGHQLDQRDPQDMRMIPVWMSIYDQVSRERLAGRPTGRDQLAREQAKGAGSRAAEVHHDHREGRRRGHRPPRSAVHPANLQGYRSQAAQLAHAAGAPYVMVLLHPDGTSEHRAFGSRAELDAEYARLSEHHDQYRYVAAFDLAQSPGVPIHDSVGVPAAEHAETPAPSGAPPAAAEAHEEAPPSEAPPEGKPKWTLGKALALAAAVAAGGGIIYAMVRKSSRRRSSTRARTPKVLVATATPATTARMTPTTAGRALRSLRA